MTDRAGAIALMRKDGMTYTEIAKKLGVTRQRCYQIAAVPRGPRPCERCGTSLPEFRGRGLRRFCAGCRGERERALARDLYRGRIANGLCPGCGDKRELGAFLCSKCQDIQNRLCRERTARLADSGLCVRCGDPAREGHVHCEKCADAMRTRARAMYRARHDRGLCIQCCVPAPSGKWLCDGCRSRQTENAKRRKASNGTA